MELWEEDDRRDPDATSRDNWLRIKRNDPTLTSLKVCAKDPSDPPLSRSPITEDSEIRELGRDIGKNTQLRYLLLPSNCCQKVKLLCEGFHENRSIKHVRWEGGGRLGREMFQSLTPFLESNNNLLGMDFSNCRFDTEGIHSLIALLMRRGRPLNRLGLRMAGIDDDLAEELVMQVRENPALTPKRIALHENNIGEIGFGLIATLLQDPGCTMEELYLVGNGQANDASAMLFSDALVGNSTLRVLNLGGTTGITATGLRAMSQLLCDATNINTTYASNHTLQNLKFYCRGHIANDHSYIRWNENENNPDLDQYLRWNENENKKMVARQKVFLKHFIENFKMEPFEGIHPDLFDRVLDFMNRASVENGGVTNANARHSILYGLIKNNPTVCDIAKPEPIGNDRKRKHV